MASKSNKSSTYRAGNIIGSYTLKSMLGSGGNAEVWVVEDGAGQYALKVLRGFLGDRIPRFRDEVAIMKRLSGSPGVLPLIQSGIPDSPSKQNPCWILMPIGKGIVEAIHEEFSPEKAINAILQIARTLEGLHEEKIYHRDIKPDNLFLLDGKFVIGDFGLVDFPEKDTHTGRQLGSRNYIAPEMLNHAHDSNGGKADVYSLAKTLWSILSGNAIPPGGAHAGGESPIALGNFLETFDQIDSVDKVLEMATDLSPSKRLSMREFADELEYWLKPNEVLGRMNKNEALAKRFHVLSAPAKSEYKRQLEFEDLKRKINSDMVQACGNLKDALKILAPESEIRFNDGELACEYFLKIGSNKTLIKSALRPFVCKG